MLIAEANVETERSGRYLVQICQHVNTVGRAHPQMQAHVEWSDDRGGDQLRAGQCTLRALLAVLTLRAEAPYEATLRRVQQPIAERLERIGRRDHLTVTWTPPRSRTRRQPAHPPDATANTRGPHMAVMHEPPDNHARPRRPRT